MLDLRPYISRPISSLSAIAADPIESWLRFREQYAAHREGHTPPDLYKPDNNWEFRLNSLIELSSSDEIVSEFWSLWGVVVAEMQGRGIRPGPASFKGWNDGDAGFVRAIWCLVRHLKPRNVVETGVAHGVTSRFILEALERNANGHLWSIDRPPMEPEWRPQIGVAVGHRFRDRWSYILGSSRRRLPSLLKQLGQIDLFIHDSLHSERNVRFELDHAWPVLRPGGAIVVDDIDVNRGFFSFVQSFPINHSLVCEAEPLRPDTRRFNKKGMFGIVLKERSAMPGGDI
ncbi:class I SAM-dependent methyltransferase [Bradyrhizobium sp. CB1650]|uniref:class I SAM-dependent methyltransferase n=1 Tax=Bradyrhizobium sp. CB1650 TaxID=3039153 RepID=UPI002434B725|nr:class I SAM-dependent methyltransferase [Bradyrhizobium sp. CB1650]WGD54976.1 class I SAM-dependent methyltransferase [Bradyrhizobium sp. CB1650]